MNLDHTAMRPLKTPTLANHLADIQLTSEQNITFQVFDILRNLIVSVKLRPGQRVSEKEISAALNASRTPVREALIRLSDLNLIKVVPQSGTFVTKISLKRYRTACFIRLQLELGAVREAASNPDPAQGIEILDGIMDRQTTALANEEFDLFFDLDRDFHRQLFIMAGFGDVWSTARRTQFDVNRVRHIRRMNRTLSSPVVLAQHKLIVEAIRAGSVRRAETALRTHIGDLDQMISALVSDPRILAFIEIPEAN